MIFTRTQSKDNEQEMRRDDGASREGAGDQGPWGLDDFAYGQPHSFQIPWCQKGFRYKRDSLMQPQFTQDVTKERAINIDVQSWSCEYLHQGNKRLKDKKW